MSSDANLLSTEAQHLFDQAMKLPIVERAKLADKLSWTLDPIADPEWQAAWGPEVARRIAEVENGTVTLSDWQDVRSRLWEGFNNFPNSQCTRMT